MAENRARVEAPPAVVFKELCDPAVYIVWVVGSKHIRGVDPDWPKPGSNLHHTVGWGPIVRHDTTEVLDIDPPRRLRLEARAWPLGTAEVDITLSPDGDGTVINMRETPLHGPGARFNNPLMEFAIEVRNAMGLRRLARWSGERYRGTPGHPPETP